tara:strand:+ start:4265 stop:4705 length:441 start_codon:yes stop_codon:yes gene_type:complete
MKLSAKIKALAEKFPPKITLTVVADYTSNDVTSLSAFETDSTPHLIMSDSLSPKDLSDALEPFSHKSIGDKEGLIVVLDTAFSEDDSYGLLSEVVCHRTFENNVLGANVDVIIVMQNKAYESNVPTHVLNRVIHIPENTLKVLNCL